jgi:hypothetical protein
MGQHLQDKVITSVSFSVIVVKMLKLFLYFSRGGVPVKLKNKQSGFTVYQSGSFRPFFDPN